MPYPGYLLNPGDMFQVDPSSVLFATGAPKIRSSTGRRVASEKRAALGDTRNSAPRNNEPSIAEVAAQFTKDEPTASELKDHMQDLMSKVNDVLEADVKAKDKQKFREFRQTVKKAISLWRKANPETVTTLDAQFDFLKNQLAEKAQQHQAQQLPDADSTESIFALEDQKKLKAAFKRLKEEAEYKATWNQKDASAPYATPWRPRDYMSAFAFIPRYLEVNQNICAAVYLRHPVARPGLGEVPTPFSEETGQLAFNWYLRRR
jgi:ribosomal protein S4